MQKIIECVPNFSEGRNSAIIREITGAIETVEGVKLLDVFRGDATNRTVVTFAGAPEPVMEGAFRAIKKAAERIDMRRHKGEHPRFGATDVCPLVPVTGVTMSEVVDYARQLARRVGQELKIPVYCYEYAACKEERVSLAHCRAGGYEGLKDRLESESWKPDFGPDQWTPQVRKSGATAIGARNFLAAYNVNLNTADAGKAQAIAAEIRESGKIKRRGDPLTGPVVKDATGRPVRIPGMLKKTRAIGWYIKEYGKAQVSMNLIDLATTPLHTAFEMVKQKARQQGLQVTGSELIGLIPLGAMLDAGKYYLIKQKRSTSVPSDKIISTAVRELGLDDLGPFDPRKKIIEFLLAGEPLAH